MSLNVNKCKDMRFSRSSFLVPPSSFLVPPLTFNSVPLKQTIAFKYLALLLAANLSLESNIHSVVCSANRSLGYLRGSFRPAPSNLKRLLYISLVQSKLEYASSIWYPGISTLTDSIEIV